MFRFLNDLCRSESHVVRSGLASEFAKFPNDRWESVYNVYHLHRVNRTLYVAIQRQHGNDNTDDVCRTNTIPAYESARTRPGRIIRNHDFDFIAVPLRSKTYSSSGLKRRGMPFSMDLSELVAHGRRWNLSCEA